ncbi:hypothetical protein ACM719_03795 [Pseudomonas aeruginosa]|uniref:hypothetical protein n=1 Tax=Pseudomonas aeruginosa TaxID=287 RepID=UPI00129D1472|nr:hypothetical protein [Pseudomonas aeruginosa]MDY1173902.1 hypothetical protein [Pseudomonas aeruginosa]HBP0911833.1 hypothetical protein [Pseudomonas aeruginosa]
MKNTLIGPESGRMEAVHLVHFLDSFLDIPGAAWDLDLLIYLSYRSKMPSRVRAAPRRKISDLGFLSDLTANSCAGQGAAQVYPVPERVQRRDDLLQCVEINTVRSFGHTRSRLVTKRVRMVDSAFRLGRKSAQAVGEVTLGALLRFASLVAENQQSSMRKTSKLAAGCC